MNDVAMRALPPPSSSPSPSLSTLQKLCTLEFSLLDTSSTTITIRDVQLWSRHSNEGANHTHSIASSNDQQQIWEGQFNRYIDLEKLPLWICNGEDFSVFSESATTVAYFNKKLRYKTRGIVVCVNDKVKRLKDAKNKVLTGTNKTGVLYLLFFRQDSSVCATTLQFEKKLEIDSMIKSLNGHVVQRPPNSNEQTPFNTKRRTSTSETNINSKETSIDKILKQSRTKRAQTSDKVRRNLMANDRRLQFNETLSRLILSGLRLRGIPNTKSGFQKLYRMTFQSAEFAHRDALQAMMREDYHNRASDDDSSGHRGQAVASVSFEELQESVETLLKLFTKM